MAHTNPTPAVTNGCDEVILGQGSLAKDVFDAPDVWRTSPELAYSSWINRQRYRESSKTVYIAMFGKLARWLKGKGVDLPAMNDEHLREFLDAASLTKGQRYRYVRVAERVFDHIIALGVSSAHCNPGRVAAKRRVGKGHNDATRFFSSAQRQAMLGLCREAIPDEDKKARWFEIRDRALAAVILGGGAKVHQIRRMTVNCIAPREGWLTKKDAAGKEHRARLEPWAIEAVNQWLAVRSLLNIPGSALFTGAVSGCNRVAGVAMHATSIFRRTQAFLEAAGIDVAANGSATDEGRARLCAQTLRNTYAANLFAEGAADDLVTEYLGLGSVVSAARLRAAWELASKRVRTVTAEARNDEIGSQPMPLAA